MRNSATVSIGARLHLGFLDLNGGLGRRFGGLGLALQEPETTVELSRAAGDGAHGPQSDRAAGYLHRLVSHLGLPAGHSLRVGSAIPAHAGLGSGTQLALAVAAALRRLHGLALDLEADATLLERGSRSGLGAAFFLEGGVALDGGVRPTERPAPVVARLPFPEDWRVLLIFDPSRQGVHGEAERLAFEVLPPFSEELAGRLCRLAVMQALPALVERDLSGFGRAITQIQAHVGNHFATVQGGCYASPAVSAALNRLAANDVSGYGQSSWGPTGFAFASTEREAHRLKQLLSPLASSVGLELSIVKGRNHGAFVSEERQAAHGVRRG
jgi:beta-RFAP synthase